MTIMQSHIQVNKEEIEKVILPTERFLSNKCSRTMTISLMTYFISHDSNHIRYIIHLETQMKVILEMLKASGNMRSVQMNSKQISKSH